MISKRDFLRATGLLAAAPVLSALAPDAAPAATDAFKGLPNLAARAVPISLEEHRARIAKAQRLMRDAGIDALLLEPGASLLYFTGLRLWRSERFHGAVIPHEGEPFYISPAFEEPALREKLLIAGDVLLWEEDEDPYAPIAAALSRRGVPKGRVGIEASVRHFVAAGLRRAAPGFALVSAESVVTGCRAIKSAAEIALMQIAFDITLAAYRAAAPRLEAGMTPADFVSMMEAATRALGGNPTFSLALYGPASAFPHGSNAPQILKEGDIVLMDCGAEVLGYQSDISRTIVFGEPSKRQRQVWAIEKEAQDAAFMAAQPGALCGDVDRAARAVIERHGFGPGYKLPGLPHRTGHGIGLEGHESPNFVKDDPTAIAPGMCFSNEPGIYIYGEFGVRLEDCLHITNTGPKWFSAPSPSLDDPFGKG